MAVPIFKNDYVRFGVEDNILSLTYLRKGNDNKEYIDHMDKFFKEFKKMKTNKFMVDARKMGVVALDGQQHVKGKIIPAMLKHVAPARLFHAQILPEDVFVKFMAGNVRRSTDEQFVVQPFSNEEDAYTWLSEQS